MKEIFLSELYVNNSENYKLKVCEVEFQKNQCTDKNQIEKNIQDSVLLQKKLLEEYFIRKTILGSNPELDNIGVNSMFFAGNAEDLSRLSAILNEIYETVFKVKDSRNQLVGFKTCDTSPIALEITEKLYRAGKLNSLLTHFLQGKTDCKKTDKSKAYALEKRFTAETEANELADSDFLQTVLNDINFIGYGYFMSCGYEENEIEADRYIQAFIELGFKVYIYNHENRQLKTVVIRR